mmetsp:Transcript_17059/g.48736  ORF Transcript_17059/g.48736 Transcript_17059/m.48736 type:complete len:472 (-) Transcript_17059:1440-2855(-)
MAASWRDLRLSGGDVVRLALSKPVDDRQSRFVGALAFPVRSRAQAQAAVAALCALPEFAEATHRMSAFRAIDGSSACDDDGERWAGDRLSGALKRRAVLGAAVVVARWYGGVMLGPVRFTHIVDCCTQLLTAAGQRPGIALAMPAARSAVLPAAMAAAWNDDDEIDAALEAEQEEEAWVEAAMEAEARAAGESDSAPPTNTSAGASASSPGRPDGPAAVARESTPLRSAAELADQPLNPGGNTRVCQDCGTVSLDQQMLSVYDEAICRACKNENLDFKVLTKSKAKEEFLITDDDMRKLPFVETSNPRRSGWTRMKLYVTKQVRSLSMKRWGTPEGLEAERERRAVERLRLREKRAKAAHAKSDKEHTDSALQRNIKRLRSDLGDGDTSRFEEAPETAASGQDGTNNQKKKSKKLTARDTKLRASDGAAFVPKNEAYHEHSFGLERVVDADADLYEKTCQECGLAVQFERF